MTQNDQKKNSAAEIFASNHKRLLKFITSKVRLPEDAEDILQDVFYRFLKLDSMAIEQAVAWIYKVAKNKIIDYYRKKKEERLSAYCYEDSDEFLDEIADIMFDYSTPEAAYLSSVIQEEIEAALDLLPKEQRFVFEQTEFFDIPVKELAEKTKTPVNTILSRKHYAVKFLRERLGDLATSY
jgi:RNA polymerase sigma factor (sigma-70 family)